MLEGRSIVWRIEQKDPVGEATEIRVSATNGYVVSVLLETC